MTYTQWRAGEPDDSLARAVVHAGHVVRSQLAELCAVMRPTNKWGDLDRAGPYRVVCEKT